MAVNRTPGTSPWNDDRIDQRFTTCPPEGARYTTRDMTRDMRYDETENDEITTMSNNDWRFIKHLKNTNTHGAN